METVTQILWTLNLIPQGTASQILLWLSAVTCTEIFLYSHWRSQCSHTGRSHWRDVKGTHLKKCLDDKLDGEIICFNGFIGVVFLQEFTHGFGSSANGIGLETLREGKGNGSSGKPHWQSKQAIWVVQLHSLKPFCDPHLLFRSKMCKFPRVTHKDTCGFGVFLLQTGQDLPVKLNCSCHSQPIRSLRISPAMRHPYLVSELSFLHQSLFKGDINSQILHPISSRSRTNSPSKHGMCQRDRSGTAAGSHRSQSPQ